MSIINILRNIWTKSGGWFNSLSPYEQEEFIHSAWIFVLACAVLACFGSLVLVLEPRIAHELEHVQRMILNILTLNSF